MNEYNDLARSCYGIEKSFSKDMFKLDLSSRPKSKQVGGNHSNSYINFHG